MAPGRAVDVMIPDYRTTAGIRLGDDIAGWARTHAHALGVTYIIWRAQIWSAARAAEGWRPCRDGSCYAGTDDSAAHRDHLHISVHGHAATGLTAADQSQGEGRGAALPVTAGTYRLTARFHQQGAAWASGRHTGLDFAAPAGTPVHAVVDGTIITATRAGGPYGHLTKLRTDDGTVLYYAHQSHIGVSEGQRVAAGAVIGRIGTTGNSFGPHLHFEVRVNGTPIDPEAWLRRHGLQP